MGLKDWIKHLFTEYTIDVGGPPPLSGGDNGRLTRHQNSNYNGNNNSGKEEDEEEEMSFTVEDWEWVLSQAERLGGSLSREKAVALREELDTLRDSLLVLRMRPYFLNAAEQAWNDFQEQETHAAPPTVLSSGTPRKTRFTVRFVAIAPLDSAKRSKIISDVVYQFQHEWLEVFKKIAFHNLHTREHYAGVASIWETFVSCGYFEQTYSKGVIGSVRDVGFNATHAADRGTKGLTPRVLADVIWQFAATLLSSIKTTFRRAPNFPDFSADPSLLLTLCEKVAETGTPLLRLWYETVQKSRAGSSKEGCVTEQWKVEDLKRKQHLESLRESGLIDARFEPSHSPKDDVVSIDQESLQFAKDKLAQHLKFRTWSGSISLRENYVI